MSRMGKLTWLNLYSTFALGQLDLVTALKWFSRDQPRILEKRLWRRSVRGWTQQCWTEKWRKLELWYQWNGQGEYLV